MPVDAVPVLALGEAPGDVLGDHDAAVRLGLDARVQRVGLLLARQGPPTPAAPRPDPGLAARRGPSAGAAAAGSATSEGEDQPGRTPAARAAAGVAHSASPRGGQRWRGRPRGGPAARAGSCRLSYSFLPLATAISTLARPSLKYSASGTMVWPALAGRPGRSCRARVRCRSSLRRRRGVWLVQVPDEYSGMWHALEPQLVAGEPGPAVDERGPAHPQRLDLGADEDEPRLEGVLDEVVVAGLAVARHELRPVGLRAVLGHERRRLPAGVRRGAARSGPRRGRQARGC